MSRERNKIINYELIVKALHPSRITKWIQYHLENGKDISDFQY